MALPAQLMNQPGSTSFSPPSSAVVKEDQNGWLQWLMDQVFGKGAETRYTSNFSPEQSQIFPQILMMALQGLQNPQEGFEPIAQRARSQFQSDILPSINERLTSMGGENRLSSGTYQGAKTAAGLDLEERLASLGAQYGLKNKALSQNLLGVGLTPQFSSQRFGAQPGFVENAYTKGTESLPYVLKLLSAL